VGVVIDWLQLRFLNSREEKLVATSATPSHDAGFVRGTLGDHRRLPVANEHDHLSAIDAHSSVIAAVDGGERQ
jgi:hypothetical protein